MTVERGKGVTYIWYDVPENAHEQVEPWTAAAVKIREVTQDVLHLAISTAPVGRERDDQLQKIEFSHYVAAGIRRGGAYRYQQVVGNRAPHAFWVHEGTGAGGKRRKVVGRGTPDGFRLLTTPRKLRVKPPKTSESVWMGPVYLGGGHGSGRVGLAPGPPGGVERWSPKTGAVWTAFPTAVMFHKYLWKGQSPNPWLAEAGRLAANMPGNR